MTKTGPDGLAVGARAGAAAALGEAQLVGWAFRRRWFSKNSGGPCLGTSGIRVYRVLGLLQALNRDRWRPVLVYRGGPNGWGLGCGFRGLGVCLAVFGSG